MAEMIERECAAATGLPDREGQIRRWRRLARLAERRVRDLSVVPPLVLPELLEMAETLAGTEALRGCGAEENKLLSLMIHNAAWRDTVAAVPFERRLLLLPQCLRSRDDCRAETDAYGLLCRDCGQCPLGRLQREAIDLGYVVLIAEGTGAVTGLLKEGAVDAVIGASCLPALEQSFRHLAEDALPSLAVPLLRSGCNATDVDLDLLLDYIRLKREPPAPPAPSIEVWRERVSGWFTPRQIDDVIQPALRHAHAMAIEWLCAAGKRWRPLLAATVHDALQESAGAEDTRLIRHVAVAAECFHKASLIHDDIEDGDTLRYGRPTLHCAYGIPAALNAGDLLLGEGYRLLAHCPVEPHVRLRMLSVAAEAHRNLCLGQGEELQWRREPGLLGVSDVMDLFRLKTVPAFEVAILLGAISGGAHEATCEALTDFSRALGVAYQIRDDLQDAEQESTKGEDRSPSILFGFLCDRCPEGARGDILREIRQPGPARDSKSGLAAWYRRVDAASAAHDLQAEYRVQALRALAPIRSIRLKSILTRLVKRILP